MAFLTKTQEGRLSAFAKTHIASRWQQCGHWVTHPVLSCTHQWLSFLATKQSRPLGSCETKPHPWPLKWNKLQSWFISFSLLQLNSMASLICVIYRAGRCPVHRWSLIHIWWGVEGSLPGNRRELGMTVSSAPSPQLTSLLSVWWGRQQQKGNWSR